MHTVHNLSSWIFSRSRRSFLPWAPERGSALPSVVVACKKESYLILPTGYFGFNLCLVDECECECRVWVCERCGYVCVECGCVCVECGCVGVWEVWVWVCWVWVCVLSVSVWVCELSVDHLHQQFSQLRRYHQNSETRLLKEVASSPLIQPSWVEELTGAPLQDCSYSQTDPSTPRTWCWDWYHCLPHHCHWPWANNIR